MDLCVCCGSPVPEGTQICWRCLNYPYNISFNNDDISVTYECEE